MVAVTGVIVIVVDGMVGAIAVIVDVVIVVDIDASVCYCSM